MPQDLLKLPLQIQLVIAGGYAAYLLSYVGIRDHHTAVDTTFYTLIFGLIATGIYSLSNSSIGVYWGAIAAFTSCCVAGLFWRKFGSRWLTWILRYLNFSWSDDDPSALASILANSEDELSQLSVLLDDGTWLQCRDVARFINSPFGPCKLGPKGDVAFYVTHIQEPGKQMRELQHVIDETWGDMLTYIPEGKVKYIKYRTKKKA